MNISIEKFKIKYILVKSLDCINNAITLFQDGVSDEIKRAYTELLKREIPSATITFAIDEKCQAVTIKDNSKVRNILFNLFGLDPNKDSWDDFVSIALEQEVNAVVLSGEMEKDNNLSNYILAFYNEDDYEFVNEHFSFICPGPVKRPICLYEGKRNMLDVCVKDLKMNREQLIKDVEKAIGEDNKKLIK